MFNVRCGVRRKDDTPPSRIRRLIKIYLRKDNKNNQSKEFHEGKRDSTHEDFLDGYIRDHTIHHIEVQTYRSRYQTYLAHLDKDDSKPDGTKIKRNYSRWFSRERGGNLCSYLVDSFKLILDIFSKVD